MSSTTRFQGSCIQNYLLLWLDDRFHQNSKDVLAQLRNVVNEITIFTQSDECVDFLTDIDDRTVFLMVSEMLSKQLVPLIHDVPHLYRIYIFDENKTSCNEWAKVVGSFTEIKLLCDSLRASARQCDYAMIPISFIAKQSLKTTPLSGEHNLDQLEPTYMYSMIFKEILLEFNDDNVTDSLKDLINYCRQQGVSESQLNRFQHEYHNQSSIWWYTSGTFIYGMLNCALRTFNTEAMIKMGFFIRKLHQQLETLHKEQSSALENRLTVYRGQGLSQQDFQHLLDIKGGLLAFNSFLSTSKDHDVAWAFAESILDQDNGIVSVLFIMTVNSESTTPFASIDAYSAMRTEEEILFSMHSVFRVIEIKPSMKNNLVWEVQVTLTDDNDPQLAGLMGRMQKEIDGKGWHRMGKLMIRVGHFTQAEILFTELLKKTKTENGKASCYYQLGEIRIHQGQYKEAISFNEKTLEILLNALKKDDRALANIYNSIGLAYNRMSDHTNALEFYQKAISLKRKILSASDPDLAVSYNNISCVYDNIGQYSKAFEFSEEARRIWEMALPSNHPMLASCYHNIGQIASKAGIYTKALDFYEKALKIWKLSLPPNHPEFALSYNNIAAIHSKMGNYLKAIEFYTKSIEIKEKAIPLNYRSLATSYSNVGTVYVSMFDFLKALEFCAKACDILEDSLPLNDPEFASCYNNLAQVHFAMMNHPKAFEFYQKAYQVLEITVLPDYLLLATVCNNIGQLHSIAGDHLKALESFGKAQKIYDQYLPPSHPSLATLYNNIGQLHCNMGEYFKALAFLEKSNDIFKNCLPFEHPDLAASYWNMGVMCKIVAQYSKALQCLERALQIFEKVLPSNHKYLELLKLSINEVKEII
ncbi:unnamed protein product [Adineta ricciae]|uniref:NAD(P)(+)--arginine ADP-ribosyltransferase n=1 Tax=Adineta ricciae TaxID=249248 RepID=A0A815KT64_ADIRI|nr:unnamed protein product [Adineta ricciae]CAF1400467.1 unnamed protein product [Adineta ricciae]